MNSIKIKNINDLKPYAGPHALAGIQFCHAREPLGVSAWGMNVLRFEANCELYPAHDHKQDGQEEVYLVLDGSVVFQAQGEERVVERGDFIHVPPDVSRKFITREHAATLLALGGTPGEAYAATPTKDASS